MGFTISTYFIAQKVREYIAHFFLLCVGQECVRIETAVEKGTLGKAGAQITLQDIHFPWFSSILEHKWKWLLPNPNRYHQRESHGLFTKGNHHIKMNLSTGNPYMYIYNK